MVRAVSFDLFGTLVEVNSASDPATEVADELSKRGISVPADWHAAYRTAHIDATDGEEVSLHDHVCAILNRSATSKADVDRETIDRAVCSAFETEVYTRDGATEIVHIAADRGPSAILSNCSVPGLVHRTLRRSALDPDSFDAIVTSVGCGWRKPHRRAFETVARELSVSTTDLLHVGNDPRTDGGAVDAGAKVVLTETVSLTDVPRYIGAFE